MSPIRGLAPAIVALLVIAGCSGDDVAGPPSAIVESGATSTTAPVLVGAGDGDGSPDAADATTASSTVGGADEAPAASAESEDLSAAAQARDEEASAVDESTESAGSADASPAVSDSAPPGSEPAADDTSGSESTGIDSLNSPTTTAVQTGPAPTTTETSPPPAPPQPVPGDSDPEPAEQATPPDTTDVVVATKVGASIGYPLDLVERIESGVTTEVCAVELPRQLHDEQVQPLPFDRDGTPIGDLIALADEAMRIHLDLVRACDFYPGDLWDTATAELDSLRSEALGVAERAGVAEAFQLGMAI